MKKILPIVTVMVVLMSCGSKQSTETTANALAADTAGLAEFQSMKKEQLQPIEMQGVPIDNNILPAMPSASQPVAETKIIYRDRPAKTKTLVQYVKPEISGSPAGATRDAVYRNEGSADSSTTASSNTGSATGGKMSEPVVTSVPSEPQPAKKEGWSKAAKGAVIGGASGAVLGAIISKNKVKGAVIGGVVGAAGGYIFGKSKDKKAESVPVASSL